MITFLSLIKQSYIECDLILQHGYLVPVLLLEASYCFINPYGQGFVRATMAVFCRLFLCTEFLDKLGELETVP